MSNNLEALTKAGIIGTSFAITPEDQPLLENLTAEEVNTLIAIKAKLNPSGSLDAASAGPTITNTVSF
jgi:hypothetical protein